MFIRNTNQQNPRRHHHFFLRRQTCKGESPTEAGDDIALNDQQGSHRCHPTSSRPTGRGKSSGECEPAEDEQEGDHDLTAVTNEQGTAEMQSQYQKDFPPLSSCHRRRTPALPQPDTIGINPAFRIDFSTVQRYNFPGWSPSVPGSGLRPSIFKALVLHTGSRGSWSQLTSGGRQAALWIGRHSIAGR
uniref:uncharacterized protein si:dkeyp-69c1.9 isoform X2 n=1 Tax=Gasterosteus aculeatus aculeatus TaxID=481459 RepID=UPI001A9A1177|nr:uncharacterized protein si:dkeyp-69c1.9 isoform X2 [Gasterosteus aculeatus aculeatus]